MRDAFGGEFMIRLFLVFVFIYIAFAAVSLNYARAFRVKNKVIDFIEQNEIISFEQLAEENLRNELQNILDQASYTKTCTGGDTKITVGSELDNYCYSGIYIEKNIVIDKNSKSKTIHYSVSTSADWNLGALNKILALAGKGQNSEKPLSGTWTITGEAIVVDKYTK